MKAIVLNMNMKEMSPYTASPALRSMVLLADIAVAAGDLHYALAAELHFKRLKMSTKVKMLEDFYLKNNRHEELEDFRETMRLYQRTLKNKHKQKGEIVFIKKTEAMFNTTFESFRELRMGVIGKTGLPQLYPLLDEKEDMMEDRKSV